MTPPVRDIPWLTSMTEALAQAQQRQRMIVVKALGQGLSFPDDW